jgi:hypothetical protein
MAAIRCVLADVGSAAAPSTTKPRKSNVPGTAPLRNRMRGSIPRLDRADSTHTQPSSRQLRLSTASSLLAPSRVCRGKAARVMPQLRRLKSLHAELTAFAMVRPSPHPTRPPNRAAISSRDHRRRLIANGGGGRVPIRILVRVTRGISVMISATRFLRIAYNGPNRDVEFPGVLLILLVRCVHAN